MALMVDSFNMFQPYLKQNKLSLETIIVVIQIPKVGVPPYHPYY